MSLWSRFREALLLPTRQQWSKWSKPAKITVVSFLFGIISFGLNFGLNEWRVHRAPPSAVDRTAAKNQTESVWLDDSIPSQIVGGRAQLRALWPKPEQQTVNLEAITPEGRTTWDLTTPSTPRQLQIDGERYTVRLLQVTAGKAQVTIVRN